MVHPNVSEWSKEEEEAFLHSTSFLQKQEIEALRNAINTVTVGIEKFRGIFIGSIDRYTDMAQTIDDVIMMMRRRADYIWRAVNKQSYHLIPTHPQEEEPFLPRRIFRIRR